MNTKKQIMKTLLKKYTTDIEGTIEIHTHPTSARCIKLGYEFCVKRIRTYENNPIYNGKTTQTISYMYCKGKEGKANELIINEHKTYKTLFTFLNK
tara:strand:+ start:467 stop:754 length:288 start_codon:yes stop_codon:yes gene_type:complete